MAEFKLGRIRFVWKGSWITGYSYLVDDVISNGGKSYICIENHTASPSFTTDIQAIPTKWNIVADGTTWKGNWLPTTVYNAGDIIKYGALVYVCNTGHTSATYTSPSYLGLEQDLNFWDPFASSFAWKSIWTTSTRYKLNDFVTYGGTTYVCKTPHISSSTDTNGLEQDQNKWDIFNQGIEYLGEWNDSSVRYKLNDVVKYGADLWICTTFHTSSTGFDETKWEMFINGIQFEDSWSDSAIYQIGDTVTYGGYSYIAKTNNTNKLPTANVSDWDVFTTGFSFQGEWNSSTSYKIGQVIRQHGYTYVAIADTTNEIPTNTAFWSRLNSGLFWTSTTHSYTGVSGTNVIGTGTGAQFDIVRTKTTYAVTITAGHAGSTYAQNDTIKILGSSLGGTTPANDLIITVATVSSGAISTISWKGLSVTWETDTSYKMGDVVLYSANSYICVAEHTAASNNKPDADTTGTYWNLISAGSEYNILTTAGDLVYYGLNGPTRLPVGIDGQVLRSNATYPIWANYGLINNLVYVGPLGRDIPYPKSGATIDQPWKTVKYAAKQIEDGYLYPNTKMLLTRNKQFLMKEVSNWVIKTYTVNVVSIYDNTAPTNANELVVGSGTTTENLVANMPIKFTVSTGGLTAGTVYYVKTIVNSTNFTISATLGGVIKPLTTSSTETVGTLSYDSTYCERDVGLIIDAVIYDLSHGGTAKTTKVAKSYYTAAGNAYITSNFGTQTIQTVAAYNYLISLMTAIANNTAPFTNYQTANSVTDITYQIFDLSLTAESYATTIVTNLVSIITHGISAGVVTAIPMALNSNTTISIKTGTYTEVLPIVVSENVALVGDELRGTIIQPQVANKLLVNEPAKTINALNRINAVIPNIVANLAVAPTTGNSQLQKLLFNANDSIATAAVTSNINIMTNIVANGLTAVPAFVIPDPSGYAAGYLNARRLIVANKQFLKDETTAYMNINYSAVWTGLTTAQKAACTRDIGYIVDALQYDLTYQGNLATVIVARSYYSNGTFVELSGEKTAALAVQARIKAIIADIAKGIAVTATSGNITAQDISGTAGSVAAGTFAQTRIQEIYDTIDTGTTPTTVAPSTTWVNASLSTANTNIQAVKTDIQTLAINWINQTYPSLVFNATLCSRDVGYILDALCYDIMFGSNFLSIQHAMSYYRSLTSTQTVLAAQIQPTLGVIGFIGATTKEITSGLNYNVGSLLASTRVKVSADIIYDMVSSGLSTEPSLILPNPSNIDAQFVNARTQIVQNYAFIKADVSQYLSNNYSSVWTGLQATGQAKCQRDIGYILDAIRYDITYGGNIQTLIIGGSYYSNYSYTIASSELTAINAAYGFLKTLINQIARKQTVTPQSGNLTAQVTAGLGDTVGTAATFAQDRVQNIIDWIANGTAPTTINPDITWTSINLQNAFNSLQSKKSEIQSDTLVWVNKFYQDINFNTIFCSRDAGLIVDALSYDAVFGSNFAAIQVGRSYNRSLTSVSTVLNTQFNAELGSINFIKHKAKMIVANGGIAQISSLVNDITSFIQGGAVSRVQWPNPSSITSPYAAGVVLLSDNKDFIKSEIIAYIKANYPSVEFNQIACQRDVGYIIDALRYDLVYGYGITSGSSNYASRQVGLSYYSTAVLQIDSNDKTATLAAYGYLKTLAQSVVQDSAVASPLQSLFAQVRAATGQTVGSAGVATSVGTLVDAIITTITNVANVPAEDLPETAWVDPNLLAQQLSLQNNRTTMRSSVISYITTNFPTLVYNSTTCSRDVGLVIDAIGYDMMFNTNYRTIEAGRSYYRTAAALVVNGQKAATLASFRYLKSLITATVNQNSTAYTRASRLMSLFIKIVDQGVGFTPEVHGSVTYNNTIGTIKAAELIYENRDFLAYEATSWITQSYGGTVSNLNVTGNVITTSAVHNLTVGDPVVFTGTSAGNIAVGTTYYVYSTPTTTSFTISATYVLTVQYLITTVASPTLAVSYSFDPELYRSDMKSYIESMSYDLKFSGNYKSVRAAQLYKNAVYGSTGSDMFYVRNSTGVRNMTLNGLTGALSEANDFGTKRPTGGCYVSLDPGFGPNDSAVWITTKSCYVQNVTNFGTGCVGLKIDGAIHSAGNRSIVANDFTQILSDGIGVWATGSNSLTELVSVFSYYGYAGYLAEYGAKIRATNGNSSYGTYGVIAEGADTFEQPIYANLDNLAAEAFTGAVITDGVNKVLRLEYLNAGTNYTNSTVSVAGDGYNVVASGDEFRDGAVFETRLIDLNDGNGSGGSNYGTAINAAQSGDKNSITIANSDTALATAYVGMRVQITGGSGVGQYANILTYSNGTKIAQVYKDSFTSITVSATAITNNLLTVASTSTLYVGMPIYLTTANNGLTANTLYYIISSNFSSTQFAVSTSLGGGAVTITTTGSVSYPLIASGWDHVIPGTTIANSLDLTSNYVIEPRISYSAPGYTATARSLSVTSTWGSATFGNSRYIAMTSNGTATQYSTDGKTWVAGGVLPVSTTWTDAIYGGGEGAAATAVVGGLGGAGAVLSAVMGVVNSIGNPGTDQVVSVTIVDGGHGYTTPPTIVFTPVSGGSGAIATCTVLNGKIDSVTVSVNGAGYTVAPTVAAATDRVTQINVTTWGKNYGLGSTTAVLSGGGSSNQATGTITFNNGGVASITIGNNGGSGYTSTPTVTISDSNAKYVAIANGSTNNAYLLSSSTATTAWTAGSALPATTFVALSYGNGIFVAVGGTNGATSSTTATSWISRTIPTLSAGTYSAVTYGNGVFVAISTGNNATASSSNGTAWTAGGNLPSSTIWTSIAFGNNRFVAIASGGTSTAYSLDNGITWASPAVGLPVSATWTRIEYAQGVFFAIAQGTTVAATSPDGINWTSRTMPGTATNWSGLAFGNVSKIPLWIATSNTSGAIAASMNTGATALGRMKAQSGTILEVRMIEPGSGYPKGTVTATTITTNVISVNNTENLIDSQPVVFTGASTGGLVDNKVYYVIGSTIVANTSFKVSLTAGSATAVVLTTTTGLTGTFYASPIVTQTDPNKIKTAALQARVGNGALANPSFSNRGTGNISATAVLSGDGSADTYQPSTFIAVRNLHAVPQAGSNVMFSSISGTWYKLVAVTNVLGNAGAYTATFQISPGFTVLNAPADGDLIKTTLKYSQVRLTGHDYLYIGTGNQSRTNFPFTDPSIAVQSNQQLASGGGRVFFTSTDQDGNFNVGNLFGVQQSTGTATLNADAFNLSGLQSLQLSGLSIGAGSATVNQFSTDPYFTANSDSIVPTQRAIKSYITSQIGGGQSTLNVNSLTAGVVYVANNLITTTSGGQLNITAKMNFTGGIDGAPVALAFFMQR
jgi:hypothetical protein